MSNAMELPGIKTDIIVSEAFQSYAVESVEDTNSHKERQQTSEFKGKKNVEILFYVNCHPILIIYFFV